MNFSRVWMAALLFCAPMALRAADKDVIELQRDVALVSDQVKTLQTAIGSLQNSVTDKLAGLTVLVQQTLDRANQNHTDNAILAKTVADQLRDQEMKITAPVAGLNAKLEQVATQLSTTQDSLSDVNARLGRLEQRMVDLENAVKIIQAPPAQPPSGSAGGGPPAGVTASGLFDNATRDQLSGKADLALHEYQDYVKYFGDTEMAAAAQFHIGEILVNQENYDDAITALDMVVTQYPKSANAPDALYLKAQAQKKSGDRAAGNRTLSQLIRQYPDSDAAQNAKTELPRPRRSRK